MNDFLNMGGYGAYVWSAYGVWLLVMLINYVQPRWREKKVFNELARRYKLKNNNNYESTS